MIVVVVVVVVIDDNCPSPSWLPSMIILAMMRPHLPPSSPPLLPPSRRPTLEHAAEHFAIAAAAANRLHKQTNRIRLPTKPKKRRPLEPRHHAKPLPPPSTRTPDASTTAIIIIIIIVVVINIVVVIKVRSLSLSFRVPRLACPSDWHRCSCPPPLLPPCRVSASIAQSDSVGVCRSAVGGCAAMVPATSAPSSPSAALLQ
jgi:hypothetical protein